MDRSYEESFGNASKKGHVLHARKGEPQKHGVNRGMHSHYLGLTGDVALVGKVILCTWTENMGGEIETGNRGLSQSPHFLREEWSEVCPQTALLETSRRAPPQRRVGSALRGPDGRKCGRGISER